MDVKRKASDGVVAIPAKRSKNELAIRYGARSDIDENVSNTAGSTGIRCANFFLLIIMYSTICHLMFLCSV